MWWFYKEKKLLISIIVIILDGVITYLVPSFMNKLNYFYPMLTISFIPFLCANKKNSYLFIFIFGIIYDLLYSNIFLYNATIFLGLAITNRKLIKYFNTSLFLFIILSFLNIFLYDILGFLLVIISNYQSIALTDLIYKIEHSILLNIMSVFVFYFMLKKDVLMHKMYW